MLDFCDIIGQEEIKRELTKAVETGHVSHAYLFIGESGMGKQTLSRAFARMLLCEKNPGKEAVTFQDGALEVLDKQGIDGKEADKSGCSRELPCRKCHACIQVEAGTHPDIITVLPDAKSRTGSTGVDTVRSRVMDTVDIRPYSGKYKIYIIPDAQMMTVAAQNAILKTIEEPPEYALVMLLVTNEELLLDTIRSRTVRIKLRPLTEDEISSYIVKKTGCSESDAVLASVFAGGNMGKAIALTESETFFDNYRHNVEMLSGINDAGMKNVLEDVRSILDRYSNPVEFLDFSRMWYRDIMLYSMTHSTENLYFIRESDQIRRLSGIYAPVYLNRITDAISAAQTRLSANVNAELTLQMLLLTMKETNSR